MDIENVTNVRNNLQKYPHLPPLRLGGRQLVLVLSFVYIQINIAKQQLWHIFTPANETNIQCYLIASTELPFDSMTFERCFTENSCTH